LHCNFRVCYTAEASWAAARLGLWPQWFPPPASRLLARLPPLAWAFAMNDRFDCVVLGAGPAGAVAAGCLARAGWRTLLVERDSRPHAGPAESLDGEAYQVVRQLGVRTACPGPRFREDMVGRLWHAAQKQGARMLVDCRAHAVLFAGDQAVGVRVELPSGDCAEIVAPQVIDASGQTALLANQLGLKQPQPGKSQTIIWGAYQGVPRLVDLRSFYLTIEHQPAWLCATYLDDDWACFALVGDTDYLLTGRGTPEEIFEDELVRCPSLARQLMSARLVGRFLVSQHQPFSVRRDAGDGWRIIGDARQPAEPILSSGLNNAVLAGAAAARTLSTPAHGFLPADRLSVPAVRLPC
jgi:flavin-dependent dehydrogenase